MTGSMLGLRASVGNLWGWRYGVAAAAAVMEDDDIDKDDDIDCDDDSNDDGNMSTNDRRRRPKSAAWRLTAVHVRAPDVIPLPDHPP